MRTEQTRAKILATLTFWLRPAFVLRCATRFQRLAGFDRAVGLAAGALTALVPLVIVLGGILSRVDGKDVAQRMIERYELTGAGAEAVRDALAPATASATGVTALGLVLLFFAVLSFTRAAQRLVEQGWELSGLGVRNSLNGLTWVGGLALYALLTGAVRGLLGGGLSELDGDILVTPLTVLFFVWSGRVLSAGRIAARRLLPAAVLASLLLTAYTVAAGIYLPHMFSSYAGRYGVIGAAFAMIAALVGVMVVIVVSVAVGREFDDELTRVGRGERPPEDEVRREWDALVAESKRRWEVARQELARRRARRERRRRDSP